jgi:hypothetical protein
MSLPEIQEHRQHKPAAARGAKDKGACLGAGQAFMAALLFLPTGSQSIRKYSCMPV